MLKYSLENDSLRYMTVGDLHFLLFPVKKLTKRVCPLSSPDLRSVAAIEYMHGDMNIAGPLRMVQYAWFLTEHYFPKHKNLCLASGLAMYEYVNGNKTAKDDIE